MDKFEKSIRQKFDGYKVQPSDELWHKISVDLPKGRSFLSNAAIYTVLLAVTFTAVAWFMLRNKDTANQEIIASSPSEVTLPKEIKRQVYTSKDNQEKLDPKKKVFYVTKVSDDKAAKVSDSAKGYRFHIDCFPVDDEPVDFSDVTLDSDYQVRLSPYKGCAPLQVNMSVEGVDDDFISVEWFVNGEKISGEREVSCVFGAGKQVITLVINSGDDEVSVVDTINVSAPPHAQFVCDSAFEGETVIFVNKSVNAESYQWNFGDGQTSNQEQPSHVYTSSGNYVVTLVASNGRCSDTAESNVHVARKTLNIIFPNAIVASKSGPTGGYYNSASGQRNVFYPLVRKPLENYKLEIYDKTGKLVFVSNDVNIGWDGYYRNELLPVGVYVFVASGTFQDGQSFYLKGDVTLLHEN